MAEDITVGKVQVELSGDATKLEAASKKGEAALKKVEATSNKTTGSLGKLGTGLNGSADHLRNLANAAGISTDKIDRTQFRMESLSKATGEASGAFAGLSRGALLAGTGFAVLAAGAAFAAGKIAGTVLEIGELAEQQEQLAQKTGISVQTQQEWSVAMAENNFSAQSFTTGMRTLSQQVIAARDESSEAALMFRSLGITSEDTGTIISQVADTFSKMEDGVQKARIANILFGRSGLDLIPILNKGSQAFADSAQKAREYGLVLSKEQVQALTAADDAWDRLGEAIKGFKTQVAVFFAPWVEVVLNKLTEWIALATKVIDLQKQLAASSAPPPPPQGPTLPPKLPPGSTKVLPPPSPDEQSKMLGAMGDENTKFGAPEQLIGSFARGTASLGLFIRQMRELGKLGVLTQQQLGQAIVEHTQRYDIATEHAKDFAEQAVGSTIIDMTKKQMALESDRFQMEFENGQTAIDMHQQLLGFIITGQDAEAANLRILIEENEMLNEATRLSKEKLGPAVQYSALQQQLIDAYDDEQDKIVRNIAIRDTAFTKEMERINAVMALQEQRYAQESGLLGSTGAIRAVAFAKLNAETAQAYDKMRAKVFETYGQTEFAQEEFARKAVDLELETQAKRMQIVGQYPDFFEQQMKQLVQSNVFSLAQITGNFTNATAQWIVTGKGFEGFITQLQVTLVQSFLNMLVQQTAMWLLAESQKTALAAAGAASRITIATTEAGTVITIDAAKNAAVVAGNTAAATATAGVWAGASTFILGAYGTVTSGFSAMTAAMVGIVTAVGEFITGVLSAIAEALYATVFGSPWAAAITVGIVAIVAALAATGNLGFEQGGIGDFGSGTPATLHGQEAIIPLNSRGAGFMAEMLGIGSQSKQPVSQYISVELNGRVIAQAVADDLPSVLQLQGVPAL